MSTLPHTRPLNELSRRRRKDRRWIDRLLIWAGLSPVRPRDGRLVMG